MATPSVLLLSLALVSDPEPVAPVPDASYSLRVNRAARGVGIGIRQGLWGSGFGQSLHVDVPFGKRVGQFFGMRLQGTVDYPMHGPFDPVVFGGLEIFGRSPVIGGIARVYGGGGVFAGGRPHPTADGRH